MIESTSCAAIAAEHQPSTTTWPRAIRRNFGLLAALLLSSGVTLSLPAVARAQDEEEAEDGAVEEYDADADEGEGSDTEDSEAGGDEAPKDGDSEETEEGDEKTQAAEADVPQGPVRIMAREHRPGFATYRLPQEKVWAPLTWAGGTIFGQTEIDVGYASYKYPEDPTRPEETLHDMRGRFVLGPMFHYQFPKSESFLRVVAQFVAWVREQADEYQINADDVYVQYGSGDTWDLQVGRFMTWRVYHKGLGFDLFTLEDNGASKLYPISNGVFAVHTYEVDHIFLRNAAYVGGEVAGRAAFHYYPSNILGFELAAAYGLANNQGANTIGARLAADLQWSFLRLSAGGEYRTQSQTGPQSVTINQGMPNESSTLCVDCGASNNYGAGGSVVLSFSPVTVGGAVAIGWDEKFQGNPDPTTGIPLEDPTGSGRRLSFGGYGEFDLGTVAFERPLILGAGAHRTEFILENLNQEFHFQAAAYAALPLGVNDAMVKLIVSMAKADLYDATDEQGTAYVDRHPESTAVRLRFSSNF